MDWQSWMPKIIIPLSGLTALFLVIFNFHAIKEPLPKNIKIHNLKAESCQAGCKIKNSNASSNTGVTNDIIDYINIQDKNLKELEVLIKASARITDSQRMVFRGNKTTTISDISNELQKKIPDKQLNAIYQKRLSRYTAIEQMKQENLITENTGKISLTKQNDAILSKEQEILIEDENSDRESILNIIKQELVQKFPQLKNAKEIDFQLKKKIAGTLYNP